ncbi:hypothetical protein BBB56_21880 [Candidatus Pantoea deserta]|uniref:Uncharacterized protein n=1 Tax=Candidatus Pantoea deserta TaxID=1869313 RepID=A0A3N4NI28_9GAMM|nr:hypothetical protein BBB56_21880 [Pantoea deserta]
MLLLMGAVTSHLRRRK